MKKGGAIDILMFVPVRWLIGYPIQNTLDIRFEIIQAGKYLGNYQFGRFCF